MLTLLAARIVGADFATPAPSSTVDPNSVTPGFVGFAAMALVVAVVVFLIVDMLRRIRRAGYRADVNEKLDAEAQAQADAAVEASDVDDQDIDPQNDGTNR